MKLITYYHFFFFKKNIPYLVEYKMEESNNKDFAKSLVAELAPPHVQSAWGSRREMVRAAELAAYCNYFSKKKK